MSPYLQYAKYQDAQAKWDKLTPKKQHDHPEWKPATVVTDPDPTGKNPLPDWEDWIKKEESGVPKLIETVNTLVGYSEGTPATATAPATTGLQVEMAQHWKAAIDNIWNRLQKVVVAPQDPRGIYYISGVKDPGPFWVVDTEVGRPYKEYTVAAGDTLTSIRSNQWTLANPGPSFEPADLFFISLGVFDKYGLMTGFPSIDDVLQNTNFLKPGMVLRIPPYSRDLADAQYSCRAGALLAYEWENSMDRFALSGITEADITDFGKTIQLWKRARASVQFKPYPVQAGDTLLSIAGGDAVLADKIYKFNSDTLSSPTQPLVAGQVINIPDPSVLSDIQ